MSNKYLWNGYDINEITEVDTDLGIDEYINFPGDTTDISYEQYDDNVSNYLINGGCIFNTDFSGKKIRAKKVTYNDTGGTITVNIPTQIGQWCNRVKVVVKSASGTSVYSNGASAVVAGTIVRVGQNANNNNHNHHGNIARTYIHRHQIRNVNDNSNDNRDQRYQVYNWGSGGPNRNRNHNENKDDTNTVAYEHAVINTNNNENSVQTFNIVAQNAWSAGTYNGGSGSMVYTNNYQICDKIEITITNGQHTQCILKNNNNDVLNIKCINGSNAISETNPPSTETFQQTDYTTTPQGWYKLYGHGLSAGGESRTEFFGPPGIWSPSENQWNNRTATGNLTNANNRGDHNYNHDGTYNEAVNFRYSKDIFQMENDLGFDSTQLTAYFHNTTYTSSIRNPPQEGNTVDSVITSNNLSGVVETTNSDNTQEVIVYFFYVPE